MIEPVRTALLVIDLQNYVLDEAKHPPRPVFYARVRGSVLPNLQNLLAAARAAEVEVIEPTGSDTLVFCRLGGSEVCAEFKERHAFAPGQAIRLAPQLDNVHLFDAETGQRLSG